MLLEAHLLRSADRLKFIFRLRFEEMGFMQEKFNFILNPHDCRFEHGTRVEGGTCLRFTIGQMRWNPEKRPVHYSFAAIGERIAKDPRVQLLTLCGDRFVGSLEIPATRE